MQHFEDTKKDRELGFLEKEREASALHEVMHFFKIHESFSGLNILKRSGLTVSTGLTILLILPFYGLETICKLFTSGASGLKDLPKKKDAYYAIKNSDRISWRLLVFTLAVRFTYLVKKHKLSQGKTTALILDDTVLSKTGKQIEGVGVVHDHVSNSFVLGFKLLVCGFWEGESFIPVDFSLHREAGKELANAENKVKRAEKQLFDTKTAKQGIEKKLRQKEEGLAVSKKAYADKGGMTRAKKLAVRQKAVTKIQQKLADIQRRCKKQETALTKAKENLKEVKENKVFFGLLKKVFQAQYKKVRARNTNGYKRKKELDIKKTDNGIKMLKRACRKGFLPNYILTDSWFFSLALLQCVIDIGRNVNLISMAKIGNTQYTELVSGTKVYPAELIAKHSRSAIYNRKLKAHYFKVSASYHNIHIKLFFVRLGRTNNWKMLVTTDLKISFQKLMEVYQIRWTIEVFFKDSKQYLKLGGCQSNDFDAQIADISLIMIRFMMLSFYKRIHYQLSYGGIFEQWSKQIVEASLAVKLWKLLIELLVELGNNKGVDISELFVEILRNENIVKKILKLPEILESKNCA